MAELVIASVDDQYSKLDIIKAYKNGYYRRWKGNLKKDTFVLRMPFIRTREIKRLFIHHGLEVRRLFRVSSRVDKNRPCVTKWCINSGKWIRSK